VHDSSIIDENIETYKYVYRTRAIMTRGLYILNSLFEGQKRFFKEFFQKILALCVVSIQERVMMAHVRYFMYMHRLHLY
jgi:hypothetical protein